ncbi:MAG: acyl-CoA dehydrogenase [Caulobacter sp.]|nr:acyl-CoA dehydrogenase [Caulobacter sp.]
MSTAEQEEITRVLERFVPDRAAARRAFQGGPAMDRDLWNGLAELGLTGAGIPEAMGGSEIDLGTEVAIAQTLAARTAPLPMTSVILAAHILGAGSGEAANIAAKLAAGETVVGAALAADSLTPPVLSVGGGRITGEMGLVMDGAALEVLLVPVDGRWWAVDVSAPGVTREEARSFDATRRLATISFAGAAAVPVSDFPLDSVLALAWTLLAAECVAVSDAALSLTRDYCLTREQFGEKIGRFQAIKHKLADCLVSVEGAKSAVFGAVRSQAGGVPDLRAARLAKIVAGAAGVFVATECVQIHGAIGATWEHDLHLLLRRAKAAQLTLGSNDLHLDILSADLLEEAAQRRRGEARPVKKLEDEFSLQPEDHAFIAKLRAWLDEHVTEEKLAQLRSRSIPVLQAWQAEMAEAGWAGIHWPKEYGGLEASFTQQVLYHSELASRGLPPLIGNRGLSLTAPTIIVHGTSDQKARFVEASRRGDILWASGFSEPGAGSDLASLRTRGVVEGDHIVVNGMKIWTSGADFCHWMYTLIRTGPLVPKHAGISCVMIPLDAEGVTIRPIRRLDGDPHFNEVFLDNVRVPLSNLIGEINEGWKVTKTTLAHEHSTNFLGAQQRQIFLVERLLGQLARREAAAGIDHGLRRRMAQSWINTQLLRLHGLRNMSTILDGGEPGAEGSVLKLFGQEEERRVYELQVDLRGPEGLTLDRPGKAYLGARTATIGGGTSEIHRNKIAERVMGMPRDPWADDWN